ncbi:hypothetical protein, partial [Pseudomonas sp. WS 5011]|uniref:plasmid mobilization protein n=1 Tax=Pseudomonas sp. WS 5011 TaxID=2717477 RepID=UPI0021D1AD2D
CHPCVAALRLPGRMAVEQVARWPWNAWPDESGLGGRMAWNPQNNNKNKANRITIRLSNDEFQTLSAKLDLSGYRKVSAFVRDYLITCEPKVKQVVRMDVIEVQRELMNLASMINAAKSRDELMDQVKKVSSVSLGGAR